jgi:glycosyltransferase involved in cell wall biosynthesis
MKISYAITVCNELEEVKRLVNFLLSNKREEDEIVVLLDHSNGKDEVYKYLLTLPEEVQCYRDEFKGHFADWKNLLTSYCTGDYIFQIDADEMISEDLIKGLPFILEQNPETDMYLVPRVNTVEGLTQEHIQKWGWKLNEKGWVNFPDFQMRIYKNDSNIKWKNKVHEVLEGFKNYSAFPIEDEEFVIYHPKTIDRQEKQNNYYNTL